MKDAYLPTAGETYNEWTVVVAIPKKSLCRCSCGNLNYVVNRIMALGGTKSCKPCANRKRNEERRKELLPVGKEFGKWTVVETRPRKSLCRCKCGKEKLVSNNHLLTGASDGCRDCHDADRHYGGRRLGVPREVWRRLRVAANDAVARCENPESGEYQHYGGRGITVHPDWVEDRKLFVVYLASLPGHDDPDLWLDREDNDLGYVPGNLRFVTPSVSNYNKRWSGRPRC